MSKTQSQPDISCSTEELVSKEDDKCSGLESPLTVFFEALAAGSKWEPYLQRMFQVLLTLFTI